MSAPISIDSKGYGKIYKAVMRDRNLPLLAKTIYAYFCAYAGCGCKAFPKRDKIVRDLQINKDTYTKHLSKLVQDGYISKERTSSGNLYTIMQTIPAYASTPSPEKELTDVLLFENVAARGFGTVPKLVMLDQKLTAQAKAIYAYFSSFAGAGTTAFPRRATIMRELKIGSLGTYYQHFNLLIQYGYLSAEQRKASGRFDICIYRLNDMVDPEAPPKPFPPKRKKGISEKSIHGTDGVSIDIFDQSGEPEVPMSEKPKHGGMLLKNDFAMSEKPLSEKALSEKMEYGKPGQASNNNIVTRNSYFMREQRYDHQRSLFTREAVRERLDYTKLQAEAKSWGTLMKHTLGQLDTPEEENRYRTVTDKILSELVNQLTDLLNQSHQPDRILQKLNSEEFSLLFDGLLEHWGEIRCVSAYVSASVKNFLER